MNKKDRQINLNNLLKIIYLYERLNQSSNRLNSFYAFIFFLIPINLSLSIHFKNNIDAVILWIIAIVYSLIYCFFMPIFSHLSITKLSPSAREIEDKSNFIFTDKVRLDEKLDWFKNDEYSLILSDHILKKVTFEVNIKNKIFYISIISFLFDFLIILFAFLVSFNVI